MCGSGVTPLQKALQNLNLSSLHMERPLTSLILERDAQGRI